MNVENCWQDEQLIVDYDTDTDLCCTCEPLLVPPTTPAATPPPTTPGFSALTDSFCFVVVVVVVIKFAVRHLYQHT